MERCPNCKREFYANVKGAYCEECWKAWCKNNGSFEARSVPLICCPPPQEAAKEP